MDLGSQAPGRHVGKLMADRVASSVLYSLFGKLRERPFILVEPGGNFGDQLIYRGAIKILKQAGCHFSIRTFSEFMTATHPSHAVVYIQGGGGIVPWWSQTPMRAFRRAVSCHQGITILGPQTCHIDDKFLGECFSQLPHCFEGEAAFLFTRDPRSYGAIRKVAPPWIKVAIDHDTALNLSSADLGAKQKSRGYMLYSMRLDQESCRPSARLWNGLWLDPNREVPRFEEWLLLHQRAKTIVSDYLHSAVLGAILGTPTYLLPNTYHKNQSVWDYSLSERGVHWLNGIEELPIDLWSRAVNTIRPLSYFLSRSMVKQVLIRVMAL